MVGKIGPGPEDAKAMRVLNRVLSWTEEGLELEGDQRHADIVVDMLGLEKCKGTATPGIKVEEAEGDHEELSAEEATKFRAITARINFLAQDRPELLYATTEACRHMAKPTVGAWEKVKRLGKYLARHRRAVQKFRHQDLPHRFDVFCDSNWAEGKGSRKSTSGGCVKLGSHVIKSWASTQAVVALSSGEAEYYAILKGVSVARGTQAMADDLGIFLPITVYTDSSAAKGMAMRRGLGKTRHLEVIYLWLQHLVHRGEVRVKKIPGSENPADLMTKHLSEKDMQAHRVRMECETLGGRHEMMPKVHPGL